MHLLRAALVFFFSFRAESHRPTDQPDWVRKAIQSILFGFGLFIFGASSPSVWSQTQVPVATISAANFRMTVAPNSIVASFGAQLATGTRVAETVPLPTQLLGTTVTVKDVTGASYPASLLFVSPLQINYIVPAQAAAGAAIVSIRSGDGKTSEGPVRVSAVAPAIFTANQDGKGVPAADVLRVLSDGTQLTESPATVDTDQRFIPRSINLGPAGDKVFLILFLTGLRGTPNTDGNSQNGSAENVKVLTGGVAQTPLYAGSQGTFAGLDQINFEIPRSLLDASVPGSKHLEISVKVTGFSDSNAVEIALAPPEGAPALQITGVTAPNKLVANSVIQLSGTGIAAFPDRNKISFGEGSADPRPGEVRTATASQISAVVPFGALGGSIALNSDGKRWTSEAPLAVRTSFSAVIKDTEGQLVPPIVGARVCFPDCAAPGALMTTLQAGGWFVLPDTPVGARRVFVIEPGGQNTPLPFNRTLISSQIVADRDNHLPQDIFLQAIYGPSGVVGTGGGLTDGSDFKTSLQIRAPSLDLAIEEFRFSVPAGTDATFPNGAKTGVLTLTPVRNSLTPVPLPQSVFSSAIVQISPFGVKLNPGGKLVFPNVDNLTADKLPSLFKYDLTIAAFVDTGIKGVIANDGRSIETPPGAITEASIYFVGLPRPTTTIAGRVLDSDGVTPVRGAVVRASGRQTATDGNGGFSLPDVAVPAAGSGGTINSKNGGSSSRAASVIPVIASYLRPSGRTDTADGEATLLVEGGITNLPPLTLSGSNSNRPPTILVPGIVTLYVTETNDVSVLVVDPDPGQTIASLTATGAAFASVLNHGGGSFTLRLMPGTGNAGSFPVTLEARDSPGGTATVEVTVVVLPLPIADSMAITTNEDSPKAILLTGSDPGLSPLTFAVVSQPLKGTLRGAPPSLIYTPSENFNGNDSFSFAVSNGKVQSAPAMVSIRVDPVNDAPILNFGCVNGPTIVVGEQLLCFAFTSDVDGGQTLTISAQDLPDGAKFNPGNGALEWTPLPTQTGPFSMKIEVTDDGSPPLTTTAPYHIQVVNPLPSLTLISPASIVAGTPGLLLTVTGSGFVPDSVVQWNGSARVTTFVNSGQLTAQILPTDLSSAGFANVTVFNPLPGGGTSGAVAFTINNPLPVSTSIFPTSAQTGSPAFDLTVNGSNFVTTSQVRWNGSMRTTTFVNPGQLTAAIPASDLLAVGNANVDVFNPAPGGGTSATVIFSITDPSPVITGTTPTSAVSGGNTFLLTVNGSNFVPTSRARWNGSDRPTNFINPNQLMASIDITDIAVGGIVNLTVLNPIPGNPESAPFPFTVNNPVPTLTTAFPDNIPTGSGDLAVLLTGSNFVPSSLVLWNGSTRARIFVDSTQMIVTVQAGDLTVGTVASITVSNPMPGGGSSGAVAFTVVNPAPGAISPVPDFAIAGSADTNIQVMGTGFVPNSVVRFNGSPRVTTYSSTTLLMAVLTASDLSMAGTQLLSVFNPAPGGGLSVADFDVINPLPITSSLNPTATAALGEQFLLTVNGSGFVLTSTVNWNGSSRPTTFVNSGQLTALISSTDIQTVGLANITVTNPAPAGGTSAPALVFTIGNPVPILSSISPTDVVAGIDGTLLAAIGSRFTSLSQIRFNGMARATSFVSDTMLTTIVSGGELTLGALIDITVFTPAPVGGTSGTVVFTINNPAPVTTMVEPTQFTIGSPVQQINVTGTGFVSSTVGRWNGSPRPTMVINSTALTIGIPASDLTALGNNMLTIFTPEPGGGTSAGTTVSVVNPVPVLVSLVPDSILAGGPAFVLTANGTDFVDGIVLKWNDSPRATTFVNSTQLTAQITAEDIEMGGGVEVSVTNPPPGGGNSGVLGFTKNANFGPVNPPWGEEFSVSWTLTGPLNIPRDGLTATRLADGGVLVVGGRGQLSTNLQGPAMSATELFDPISGLWKRAANMRLARVGHSATFVRQSNSDLSGFVLVVGGKGADLSAARTAEAFEPTGGIWRDLSTPLFAHIQHTATLLADGRVLIVGGEDETGGVTAATEIFDPGSRQWIRTTPLNTPRSEHSAVLLSDGSVLVVGGNSAGSSLANAEIYDPGTGLWRQVASLNSARAGQTTTLLPDGRVLVVGGATSDAAATAEIYDPVSGRWSITGKLLTARLSHTATLLTDGSVIVGGGQTLEGQVLVSCEAFDPQSGTWSTAPGLNHPRAGHAALVLEDGRILVAGGRGGAEKPKRDASSTVNPRSRTLRPQR